MKILQVSAFYPPYIGGIENYVHRISSNLVEKGHNVTVYTSLLPNTKQYEIIEGIKIHRFESFYLPLNNLFIPKLFFQLFKNADFDIVHTHGYLQSVTNFSAISCLAKKIPLVITSHGTPNYNDFLGKFVSFVYHKSIGRWTLSCAKAVIALSPSQKQILEKLEAKNIKIIPNGIDLCNPELNNTDKRFRLKYGLKNEIILLYVGSLIPRKGINYLIDSLKLVKGNYALFIVGDSPKGQSNYKEYLFQQINKQDIKNIIFTGKIDDGLLKQAYLSADIFILPSLAEGLPTVLLEAMSYKKAVIASNIPGNYDLIKNGYNGILVEPGNSKDLAQSIEYLMCDKKLREYIGFNAYNTIGTEYSWSYIVDEIEKLYYETINVHTKSYYDVNT